MSANVAAILEKLTDEEKVELFGILLEQVPDELLSPNVQTEVEQEERVRGVLLAGAAPGEL
jgi:hypothetical protein